jgi:hypothetical protein
MMVNEDADQRIPGGELSPEGAANRLFKNPSSKVEFTPRDEAEARRAVEEFARLFDDLPGIAQISMGGSQGAAETLSEDHLQGLAEIIQNADDVGATIVTFQIANNHLVATHNGKPVSLANVLALGTPWHTTKTNDELATGRFGIGLMTLRSISSVIDVHSGPYHVRLGDPIISWAGTEVPIQLSEERSTAFCLPLDQSSVGETELIAWTDRLDDSALLFLKSVRYVAILGRDGTEVRAKSLTWQEDAPTTCRIGDITVEVRRRHARSSSTSRRWLVHSVEVPRPQGVTRARKKTGGRIPIALAVALHANDSGAIYAGLPVTSTELPLRVNAQFDPVASRAGLAPNDWNRAMLPSIADLWIEIVADLFTERPDVAWLAVPLPEEISAAEGSIVHELETLLVERARSELAERSAVVINGSSVLLTELAVAENVLENVLEPEEVARLAGLELALPKSAMDSTGRWRSILDDWAENGATLPEPVTVEDALELVGDTSRPARATIALTAIGISEGFEDLLAQLPCVVTADNSHVPPPALGCAHALMTVPCPLADELRVGIQLASEYFTDDSDSRSVMKWLSDLGATLKEGSDIEVLNRLAAAGRAANCLEGPLSDSQLVVLREAFELLPREQRSALGREVGQAIEIDAYHYDAEGRVVETSAKPTEVYLSGAIERDAESLATAAGKTPYLLWTADRYATQLRSARGRTDGVGAQKFLTILGVERAPRLIAHPQLATRYQYKPMGLPADTLGSPPERSQRLKELGASYSLDDIDSPDLRAVAEDIALDRKITSRRKRASALLGALGKAWDRLEGEAEVEAVSADRTWHQKGQIRAYWLWSTGAIPWLDDTTGNPQAPLKMRLKTDATIAVHGAEATGYLRPEFYSPSRSGALSGLGVVGEPSTRDLIVRLQECRDALTESAVVETETAIIYQALAERLTSRTSVPGDLSERELRNAFAEGEGLVFTELGWRKPNQVLSGAPVFGRYHAFVPPISKADRLWRALQIRKPSIEDCIRTIRGVAKTGCSLERSDEDRLVVLQTLRVLAEKHQDATELTRSEKRALAGLPLYTSKGWTKSRPVYTSEEPVLLEGLARELGVWIPGGDVSQFNQLIAPLGIELVDTTATVIAPDVATTDEDSTDLLSRAVSLLREDLTLNDPQSANALAISWDEFQNFEVRVDPNLRVRIELDAVGSAVEIDVAARADSALGVLFLKSGDLLRSVDAAGNAIATLFNSDSPRTLAHAWLVACVAAEDGRSAKCLELAEQRAAEERVRREAEIAERTAIFAAEVKQKKGRRRATPATAATSDGTGPASVEISETAVKPRSRALVDPRDLVITSIDGRPVPARPRTSPSTTADTHPRGTTLVPVKRDGAVAPRSVTAPTPFTSIDRESVGMEVLRQVWESDTNQIIDIRSQHGVGADAIDSLDRLVELKAYLGEEPDSIRLERTQIERALTTPGYFLAVVSNLEGTNARPKVRIIIDPVHQLITSESSSITFKGVRSAQHSVVCYLERLPDDTADSEGPTQ